jgi:hypothetical protein
MLKIKQDISENPSGWQAKQIIDIIYKKKVSNITRYIFTYCSISGASHQKGPQKRLLILHQKKRERGFQKRKQKKEILSQIPEGFTIAVHRMNQYLYMM